MPAKNRYPRVSSRGINLAQIYIMGNGELFQVLLTINRLAHAPKRSTGVYYFMFRSVA